MFFSGDLRRGQGKATAFWGLPADAFCQNRSNAFSCSSRLDMIVFKKEHRTERECSFL